MSWICPKCDRELKSENATHFCARVSIDSLFAGKNEDMVLVFDKLLAVIAEWENVAISTTPNCIVFVHRLTFFVIRPMKTQLDIKFYSETPPEAHPAIKTILYAGRYENHIRLSRPDDLTPAIFGWIRDSYLLL